MIIPIFQGSDFIRGQIIRHAYIISAYKRPENLRRLVKAISGPDSCVVISVDRKTPSDVFRQMKSDLETLADVYFLPRHRSYWGGFGHVRSTIKGLNFLAKRGIDYDYVSLLTGQDYPIKSPSEISTFLENNFGKSFFENFTLPAPTHWGADGGMIRLSHLWFHSMRKVLKFPRDRFPLLCQREIPYGLAPWGGSGYWTLYREHADHVMQFIRSHPKYVRFFRRSHVPDEIFFQTILLNSPHKADIVNDDIRYIDWSDPREAPKVLVKDDWEKLERCNDLFARKFDVGRDEDILSMIDKAKRHVRVSTSPVS
jgi:hypothetical protein